MYTLSAMQIDKNIYAVPTHLAYEGKTYCYIFEGNDFNWDVKYKCVRFIEGIYNYEQMHDRVEISDKEVQDLHELHCWEDIAEYFHEF